MLKKPQECVFNVKSIASNVAVKILMRFVCDGTKTLFRLLCCIAAHLHI